MSRSAPLRPAARQDPPSDGRRAKGARSRDALLTEAVQLASVEGLEGLTIASLAERLGTAKSSVHATFGSKEALQVAAVRRAPGDAHRAGGGACARRLAEPGATRSTG
ncbi:helix-turn-helix domain-containing protein [Mycobacterium sp.]|uniref:TetR/AcrR family transcriptional regulator n=1 Tax=Mycobacterium sp. TaxID=1785 RepID=UPI00333F2126